MLLCFIVVLLVCLLHLVLYFSSLFFQRLNISQPVDCEIFLFCCCCCALFKDQKKVNNFIRFSFFSWCFDGLQLLNESNSSAVHVINFHSQRGILRATKKRIWILNCQFPWLNSHKTERRISAKCCWIYKFEFLLIENHPRDIYVNFNCQWEENYYEFRFDYQSSLFFSANAISFQLNGRTITFLMGQLRSQMVWLNWVLEFVASDTHTLNFNFGNISWGFRRLGEPLAVSKTQFKFIQILHIALFLCEASKKRNSLVSTLKPS